MKKVSIIKNKKYWMLPIFFILLGLGYLQANPPGGDGDGGGEDPTVPIDGGISFLLAAGTIYGIKKVLDKK